jgi:hypothetical protein
MNQKSGRDAISHGRKNEKKSGNHSGESIRPARYAKAICYSRVSVKRATQRCKHISTMLPTGKRAKADYLAPASALLSRALRRFAAFW